MTRIKFDFTALNGNAMALLAVWRMEARRQGVAKEEIERITREARSKDYDHLLSTLLDHSTEGDSREFSPGFLRDIW